MISVTLYGMICVNSEGIYKIETDNSRTSDHIISHLKLSTLPALFNYFLSFISQIFC